MDCSNYLNGHVILSGAVEGSALSPRREEA